MVVSHVESFFVGSRDKTVDVAPSENLLARFFRWLGFVKPPVLGMSHYNHVDLGEPGELKNGFGFR